MHSRLLKHYQAFGANWLVLFFAIGVAWYWMYAMSLPPSGHEHSWHHAHHGASDSSIWLLFAMWALMALAMMAPSFVPTLSTYHDVIEAGAGKRRDFYGLVVGYLVAWLLYAAMATYVQLQLAESALIDAQGQSVSYGLNAALLLGAGAYQFSSLKNACLSRCRMPLTFFMQHWREGSSAALFMGFRLGIVCVACCWALMLVGFVGGIMSLLWMGLATLLMTFEKLPRLGRFVTRPLGFVFIAVGIWFAYRTVV